MSYLYCNIVLVAIAFYIALFNRSNKITKKKIVTSILTFLGSIIVFALLYLGMLFASSYIGSDYSICLVGIIMEITIPIILMFVLANLYLFYFEYHGKNPVWSYIVLIACTAISCTLYYSDFMRMLELISNTDPMNIFSAVTYSPKYTSAIRIIAIVPTICLVAYRTLKRQEQ